jgi:hypothetical protein
LSGWYSRRSATLGSTLCSDRMTRSSMIADPLKAE